MGNLQPARLAIILPQGKVACVDSGADCGNAAAMLSAFTLAFRQLGDPAVLRVLGKSLVLTLLIVAVAGTGLWWLAERGLALAGLKQGSGVVALVGMLVAGWLLWRIVALAVLQFFADEVVQAVEARYYPAALASARTLGFSEELAQGLRSAVRTLGWNLAALPVALLLLVTGVGAPLVLFAVNAMLLGRELQDMVWLRHRLDPQAPPPLTGLARAVLGGTIAGLLTVPFLNLLAPLLGAAAATHLVHRARAPHVA